MEKFKRIVSVILAVMLLLGTPFGEVFTVRVNAAQTGSVADTGIAGDVTGDTIVNIMDVLRLAKYVAGWEIEVNSAAIDTTGDGLINIMDVLRLAKYVAGWEVDVFYTSSEVSSLAFTLSDSGTYYIVSGIGECTDTEITIPKRHENLPVKQIGAHAFEGNSEITKVIIPDTCTYIGDYAFYNCANLAEVVKPEALVAATVFLGASGNSQELVGIGEYAFASCQSLSQVELPEGSAVIGSNAFSDCTALTDIELPDGVTEIGDGAFSGCVSLTSAVIPETVETIGENSFADTNMNAVFFKGTQEQWETIAENSEDLTLVDVEIFVYVLGPGSDDESNKWHYDEDGNIETVVGSKGLEYELSYDGTSYYVMGRGTCEDEVITIPKYYNGLPVTEIDAEAFSRDEIITEVILHSGIKTVDRFAFSETGLTAIELPEGLRNIGMFAFCDTQISQVTFPESLVSIGQSAFEGTNITRVYIPKGVESMDHNPFAGCTELASITVHPDNRRFMSINNCVLDKLYDYELVIGCNGSFIPEVVEVTSISSNCSNAFYGCAFESFIIPDNITNICNSAFRQCRNLKTLDIGAGVSVIDHDAFAFCSSLTDVSVDENNETYYSDGGCVITKADGVVVFGANDVSIPNDGTVTAIGDWAFIGRTFTEIIIPDTVTSIGEMSFAYCEQLEDVYYFGTPEQWAAIIAECESSNYYLAKARTHYYSPLEPTDTTESYWNWDGEGNPVLWPGAASEGLEYELSEDGTYYIITGIGSFEGFSVTIPEEHEGLPVKAIGEYAFNSCRDIISITIPESVTYIGYEAFVYCGITSLHIPASVETIVGNPVAYCEDLTKLTVDPASEYYHIDNGNFIETKTKTLVVGNESGIIPDDGSVTSIGRDAFKDGTMVSIDIPDCVTYISIRAFVNCTDLAEVILPEGLIEIDASAFYKCVSLESLIIPESVTDISYNAFAGCNSLESIYFCDKTGRWADADFEAIHATCYLYSDSEPTDSYNCYWHWVDGVPTPWETVGQPAPGELEYALSEDGLSYVVVGIGDCTDTDITIPAEYNGLPVTKIGDEAFAYTDIETVAILKGVTDIGNYAFMGCSQLNFVDMSAVTYIGDDAFGYCGSLESVILPAELTYLGELAFEYCTGLTELYISGFIDDLNYAFYGCEALQEIVVDEANASLYSVDNCVIRRTDGALVLGCANSVIPTDGSVKKICDHAFYGCGIANIYIPASVEHIGTSAFAACRYVESAVVDPDNSVYHSDGNCIIHTESKTLVAGFGEYIPYDGSVEAIGAYAFYGRRISSVDIPSGVVAIESYAFDHCWNLTYAYIPETVSYISPQGIFNSCNDLTNIAVSPGNTTYRMSGNCLIDVSTMQLIKALPNCTIPDDGSVIHLAASSFTGDYFRDLVLPKEITSIDVWAFNGCVVSNVYYTGAPEQFTSINGYYDCYNIRRATVYYYSDTEPTDTAYKYWHYVDGMAAPWATSDGEYSEGLEYSLDEYGYTVVGIGNCPDSDIVIPVTYEGVPVYAIGEAAFAGNTTITSIVIPDSVVDIYSYAFAECFNLSTVSFGNSVGVINSYAFANCHTLTNFTLPNSLSIIGYNAFSSCASITSVEIPANVGVLDTPIFNGCDNLTTLTVADGNTKFYSMNNCIIDIETGAVVAGTVSSEIPTDPIVSSIAGFAFSGVNIQYLYIPENITTLGMYSFESSGLVKLVISESVTDIGAGAFAGCDQLLALDVNVNNPVYHSANNMIIETAAKTVIFGTDTSAIPTDGSVTTIGENAFSYSGLHENVVIPEGITTIEECAFYNCYTMYKLVLPASLETVGAQAFDYCFDLNDVYYMGTPEQWQLVSVSTVEDEDNKLTYIPCYYYSESVPEDSTYTYWHYVDEEPTIW